MRVVGSRGTRRAAGIAGAGLPIAAGLVPLSILALVGWLNWRAVWEDASSRMQRAADSVAEYGTRTFESYSLAAERANERLRGLSDAAIRQDEARLHDEFARMGAERPQGVLIYVIDREGHPLLASNIFPVPHDVTFADRDYFRALSGPSPPALVVSETFISQFDGRLLFSVSRRRRDTGNPSGLEGFDGIVVVSVSPLELAAGMSRLLVAPNDRMALVREDGYGISTTSGLTDKSKPIPRVPPQSPFFQVVASGARGAIYLSSTAMPGTTSLLAMRRIDGFPVYAVSLRARADIVARWWDIMAMQFAFGVPATLGLVLLSLRVWRDQRRLAASNADLQLGNALSTDRLVRAKRFGLVGTFEFDLRTGVSRRSPEYMSVHGLPAVPTEESHDDWVRRLHPDDRERAESYVAECLSDRSGATEYSQTYRIVMPSGEVRWIAARGEITRDQSGRAVMLLGAHLDITPMRTTELALAESDARLRLAQEAAGIGTWEWSRSTGKLLFSRQMMELWGFDAAAGEPDAVTAAARLHHADRWRIRREMATAHRSGQFQSEFRIVRCNSEGQIETIWVMARARLLSFRGSGSDRMMGVAYEVTERKVAEAQAALLAHEIEHRAKNALTLVSALVRISVPHGNKDFVEVLQGRISALGRATTLLGQHRWIGANIEELIALELAPFAFAAGREERRVVLSGPPVVLTPEQAQPLSMALHELATNAAKYGALSAQEGRLEVRWWLAETRCHLEWCERGGPRLEGPPPRSSFGSLLIRQVFADQLRGTISLAWEAEGLTCSIAFPCR